MTSISGSTASQHIELHLIRRNVPDPAAEKRKADRENGRQAALEFANEALLQAVSVMRTSPDAKQRLQAAKMIMDRAWGTPKADDSEQQKLKNRDILDVLAMISMENTKQITEKPVAAEKIEQKQPVSSLEDLLIGEGEYAEVIESVEGGLGPVTAAPEPVAEAEPAPGAVPAGKPRRGRPPKSK